MAIHYRKVKTTVKHGRTAEVITILRIVIVGFPPPHHGLQEMNGSHEQPGPEFFRSGKATGVEIKPWVQS